MNDPTYATANRSATSMDTVSSANTSTLLPMSSVLICGVRRNMAPVLIA